MSRDRLFLLPPGFRSQEEWQYCPECAEIWGVLAYYPALRETVDIAYETLSHPRSGLVERLGEGTWNCPTLILDDASPEGPGIKRAGQYRYLDSARDIGRYWAERYGTAMPR